MYIVRVYLEGYYFENEMLEGRFFHAKIFQHIPDASKTVTIMVMVKLNTKQYLHP